jgi:hypothetical protein
MGYLMQRFFKITAIVLAILMVVPTAIYALLYPTFSYRYRMIVSVEVDGKVRSGSSVIEVRTSQQPVPSAGISISGEAVLVDLGEGRILVSLLASGPNGNNLDFPAHVIPKHFKFTGGNEDLKKLSDLKGRWTLAGADRPTLLMFTNIGIPTGSELISYGELHAPTVEIEMTRDPVTRTIDQRISWINNPLAQPLFGRSFMTLKRGE